MTDLQPLVSIGVHSVNQEGPILVLEGHSPACGVVRLSAELGEDKFIRFRPSRSRTEDLCSRAEI